MDICFFFATWPEGEYNPPNDKRIPELRPSSIERRKIRNECVVEDWNEGSGTFRDAETTLKYLASQTPPEVAEFITTFLQAFWGLEGGEENVHFEYRINDGNLVIGPST